MSELEKARAELDSDFAEAEVELEEQVAKLREEPDDHTVEEIEDAARQAREHMKLTRAQIEQNLDAALTALAAERGKQG